MTAINPPIKHTPMAIDGESGYFLTDAEYSRLSAHAGSLAETPVERGQVWKRKGHDQYIYILAVDPVAKLTVNEICKSADDTGPKYETYNGSGHEVGHCRSFSDIRMKYELFRAAK